MQCPQIFRKSKAAISESAQENVKKKLITCYRECALSQGQTSKLSWDIETILISSSKASFNSSLQAGITCSSFYPSVMICAAKFSTFINACLAAFFFHSS